MAPSETNQSSVGENAGLGDRLENFDKLNWKGKVTVSTLVVCGLAAVSFVGVKLVRGLHGGVKKIVAKKDGGDENSLAYDVVAKGFATVQANLGPWSFQDLTLGLAAISKVSLQISLVNRSFSRLVTHSTCMQFFGLYRKKIVNCSTHFCVAGDRKRASSSTR